MLQTWPPSILKDQHLSLNYLLLQPQKNGLLCSNICDLTFCISWQHSYSIMLKCWSSDPNERPPFSSLVKFISGFAEMTAGYLDISNCNPFGTDVVTFTPCEENCDDQTEKKHDPNVGVPLNNPPVIINVQCPSEDESSEELFLWKSTTSAYYYALSLMCLFDPGIWLVTAAMVLALSNFICNVCNLNCTCSTILTILKFGKIIHTDDASCIYKYL